MFRFANHRNDRICTVKCALILIANQYKTGGACTYSCMPACKMSKFDICSLPTENQQFEVGCKAHKIPAGSKQCESSGSTVGYIHTETRERPACNRWCWHLFRESRCLQRHAVKQLPCGRLLASRQQDLRVLQAPESMPAQALGST